MNPRSLRYFPFWLTIGWSLVALVIYLSLTPHVPEVSVRAGDKFGHFLAYTVVMFWFVQLYHVRVWWSFAIGFMLMGFLLELAQGLVEYRDFDRLDLLANSMGVLLGWALGATPLARFLEAVDAYLARSS